VTYTDASAEKRKKGSDAAVRPVMVERTRPVAILHLWTLARVDLTRDGMASGDSGGGRSSWASEDLMRARCVRSSSAVSGLYLTRAREFLTVGIGGWRLNAGDAWRASCDWTLSGVRPVSWTDVSGCPKLDYSVSPMALF
jgi:hypothetical protein